MKTQLKWTLVGLAFWLAFAGVMAGGKNGKDKDHGHHGHPHEYGSPGHHHWHP